MPTLPPWRGACSSVVGRALRQSAASRFLTDPELELLLEWLPRSGFSQNQRVALRLTLETGCRTGEAIAAQWSHFDLERGIWSLPRTKTRCAAGDPPLESDAALAARAGRVRVRQVVVSVTQDGQPYRAEDVDRDDVADAPRQRASRRWMPWTPHDLRRTVRTALARLGCPRPVAEAILGHSADGIVGVYDQHSYEAEAGDWLQRWNDHLDTLRPRPSLKAVG